MRGVTLNTWWLLTVLLICYRGHGQSNRIDSLKKEISRPGKSDSLKSLLLLCNERNSLNPDTLLKYATVARTIAVREKAADKIVLADYYITYNLLIRGFWDSSIAISDRQLKTLRYTGSGNEPYVYFSLLKARALHNSNRPKESLDLLYPLLNEAEKNNDTLTQISALNGAAADYVLTSQDRKAMELGFRSLSLASVTPNLALAQQQAVTLNNLSLSYLHLYELERKPELLDSATFFVNRAIALNRSNEFIDGLAYSLGLYGTCYGYAGPSKKGEDLLLESLRLYRDIGNQYYIINAMSILGNFYVTTRQPEKGIAICLEGIQLSKKFKPNFFLYGNLASSYKLAGDYKKYGETLDQLVLLKDSIYTVNSAEALSALQTKYEVQARKYEVQAKENIIISQQLDLSRKNNLLYAILGLSLVLLISGAVVLAARKKTQAIRAQQAQVEEKRKILQAVLEAEENERKRIAADLHDGVAQKMVVAKMNLQALADYFPPFSGEQQRVYDNISSLVDESCTEVRDLSHIMMPQALVASGLTEAVKNLLNTIPDNGLLIRFSAEGDLESVDDNTQIMLYRVVQECVQNVLKHARAGKLDISVIADKGEIDIIIEDDGVGFDTSGATGGVGFQNIRSRIAYLNGRLEISSQPGAGTIIAIYVPKKA